MTSHLELPEAFVERLAQLLPDPLYSSGLASFAEPKVVGVRVNTLRVKAPEIWRALSAQGLTPQPLPWYADGFVLSAVEREALMASSLYAQGLLYLQSPSSMLPVVVLDPRPGEEVLDMAAAPGSKTLQIVCAMQGRGRIAAVEAVRHRFFKLKSNLAAQGADAVRCYHADATTLWRKVPERFDRILLDAPCSSEARFRRDDPDTHAHWNERKVAEMARKQKQLLHSAVRCLKPGGVLVYSTCSFAPEENEAVVARALELYGDALRVEPLDLPKVSAPNGMHWAAGPQLLPGLNAWRGESFHPSLLHAWRVAPDAAYDGFFVCGLRKLRSLD